MACGTGWRKLLGTPKNKTLLFIALLAVLAGCGVDEKTANFNWQGHRGARGIHPENTIPAFYYALDQGMETLELDVVITKDLYVVASHEPFINPEICLDSLGKEFTNPSNFPIFQMEFNELQKFDCGSVVNKRFSEQLKTPAFKPLLSEVITKSDEYASNHGRALPYYNIEIKSRPEWDGIYHPEFGGYTDLVVQTIVKFGAEARVSLQSFDKRVLAYIHKKYPVMSLALLEEDELAPAEHLERLGFYPDVYSCHYSKVDAQLVEFCHTREILVIPWTVNDSSSVAALMKLGVDGVITDYPNLKERFKNQ